MSTRSRGAGCYDVASYLIKIFIFHYFLSAPSFGRNGLGPWVEECVGRGRKRKSRKATEHIQHRTVIVIIIKVQIVPTFRDGFFQMERYLESLTISFFFSFFFFLLGFDKNNNHHRMSRNAVCHLRHYHSEHHHQHSVVTELTVMRQAAASLWTLNSHWTREISHLCGA